MLVDDELGSAMQSYGLVYFPFTVIVDEAGTVITRHVGPLTGQELENALGFIRGQA